MNTKLNNIAPTDLRDYIKSLGWQLLQGPLANNLYVLVNPQFPNRQLVFPLTQDAPDYLDSIENVFNKLSELVEQPVESLLNTVNELHDDTLKFRISDHRNGMPYIPMNYALTAINSVKDMFLSAASSVLKPQIHHPRLSRTEAMQLISAVRFRHTETGSFVLKVSSPVNALVIQNSLFKDDIPFVRRTTLNINNGLNKLINAIQADQLENLVDDLKHSEAPEISSNFCNAVSELNEESLDYDVRVEFSWAESVPQVTVNNLPNTIKIPKDYFARIDSVGRELRRAELQNKKEEIFMATVEHLAGEIGADYRRSGEVFLNLLQEDKILKAKVFLDADNYVTADKAHMTTGAFIKLKGILVNTGKTKIVQDLSAFELIEP